MQPKVLSGLMMKQENGVEVHIMALFLPGFLLITIIRDFDFRISDMVWGPYLPVTAYKYLTTETKQLTFKHNFDDERKQKYRRLKTSPYANDEVNRLVNACLNSTSIGKDNVPDLLSLAGISFG